MVGYHGGHYGGGNTVIVNNRTSINHYNSNRNTSNTVRNNQDRGNYGNGSIDRSGNRIRHQTVPLISQPTGQGMGPVVQTGNQIDLQHQTGNRDPTGSHQAGLVRLAIVGAPPWAAGAPWAAVVRVGVVAVAEDVSLLPHHFYLRSMSETLISLTATYLPFLFSKRHM